jgi:NAD(P)H-flavin reductase
MKGNCQVCTGKSSAPSTSLVVRKGFLVSTNYSNLKQYVKPLQLPPRRGSYSSRLLRRYREIMALPHMMHYNRLILVVVILNMALCWYLSGSGKFGISFVASIRYWWGDLHALDVVFNIILLNFVAAVLIRQPNVINLLFRIATSVPVYWPLPIRRMSARIYHLGGIHVGGTVMGTLWFFVFTGLLTHRYLQEDAAVSFGVVGISYAILAILAVMIVLALPPFREEFHDFFERSHRFGGWTVLFLFWLQAVLFVNDQKGELPFEQALLKAPAFWGLLAIAFSIALPWFRLRKVPVSIVKPSSHVALAQLDYGVSAFPGAFTTISRHPLVEWHSFANVPTPGRPGFRLAISRAGDWTGQFIDEQPSHLWVKGVPTAGVASIAKLFKSVIWVATGSGIGPVLPHLLSREVPAHLIWATKAPRATYGDALVDEILEVQPDALIWDTDQHGRPDLVNMALDIYSRSNAEAVICISNKKLTWEVVTAIEGYGIPAYGAIWDS